MSDSINSPKVRRTSRFSITSLRSLHAAISAFVAPMLIFYCLSGALQLFDLHEAHGTYEPSPILSAVGSIHKNQVVGSPAKPVNSRPKSKKAPAPIPPATMALRILICVEALALVITTLIGIWIGVTHPKYARRTWIMLVLGTVIPVILLVA